MQDASTTVAWVARLETQLQAAREASAVLSEALLECSMLSLEDMSDATLTISDSVAAVDDGPPLWRRWGWGL